MLEILVLLVATLFLAKRTPKKRRYNLRGVRFTPELPLLALASDTALAVAVTTTSDSDYRCISLDGTWTIHDMAADQGPITVGYAHSDYSVTEIKECLESQASISIGLKVEQEQAKRLVRIVGTFVGGGRNTLNDGRPIKVRLNWLIGAGNNVAMFAYNEDTAPLTTGSILNHQGKMWIKDGS